MEIETKLYEVAYLIKPSINEEAARDFHQSVKNRAQELGGLIDHEGEVYKRKLSYPIKKMTEAHVGSFRVMLSQSKTEEFKTWLNQESILRSLMVHTKRIVVRQTPIGKTIKISRDIAHTTKEPAVKAAPIDESAIKEIDKKLDEILGS